MAGNNILKSMLRIAGFWLLFGLFSIFSSYVYYEGTTVAFEWQKQLPLRLPSYLLWILFTPFLFTIADKLPIDKQKLRRILPLLFYCILFSTVHRLLAYMIQYQVRIDMGTATQAFGRALADEKFFILSALFDSLMLCAAILVYRYSVNHYREAMQSRLVAEKLISDLNAAKLQAMQMQLQPHFLFNTLHAISSLLYTEPEKADRAITLLSELLRKSLDLRDAVLIPLHEEIELTRNYLAIQEMRFGGKMNVSINISDNTNSFPVPVFILQPLLENIMKHSIEKCSVKRNILIRSELKSDTLRIFITEDGEGFSSLQTAMQNGYGLKNVHDRLAALSGGGTLSLSEDVAQGTFTIEISIQTGTHD
ncbi:MAG: histidine kinase [Ignavibacteriales bacterium]|nr:histidine kinase [Ignavibacteriales bacterium]